ncbi:MULTISPECIES: DUF1033 family protein [Enterococcus]|uniref:DUF1033 family protein n=1 Tax=Enterococcus alishanensis TaxID=1303817 RepID=A0ABS6TFA5_9ENTE|nr:DUF1033 family protein [Enterococcus alishanensis]MBV7391608.1 DUF1033 family protein [Enterococcus alishanensis]
MFQVYTLHGDNEPWWFFEDWEADATDLKAFDTFEEAEGYYYQQFETLNSDYTYHNKKNNFLSAFWDESDERWCEECDDFLQQYWGLALLENKQPVKLEERKELYETTNSSGKAKCCKRSQQSA